MKLTSPILKDLSNQMTRGNPLLGFAIANEYLSPSSPLHRAFVAQLRNRLENDWHGPQELIERLAQGQTRNQLPVSLQTQLGKRTVFPTTRGLPAPRLLKRRVSRRAPRERPFPQLKITSIR